MEEKQELTEAQRLAYLNSKGRKKKQVPVEPPPPPPVIEQVATPVSNAEAGPTVEPIEEKLPTPPATPPPKAKKPRAVPKEPTVFPDEAVDLIAQRVADIFATKYATPTPPPAPTKPKVKRRPRKTKTPEPIGPPGIPSPPRRHSFLWF